ncbi:MAG: TonB-dependent receptor [Gemmatimonadota bacterium]
MRVPRAVSGPVSAALSLWLLGAAPAAALQIAPADTIPLAPVEVSVLRTPLLETASPLAIATLSGEDLQRGRSGFFLDQALYGLPGVQVQNRYNPAVGERVAIRGFGARAQFGLRGIRVIVDGIPATLPDGQSSLDHLDVGSLERVEVIRGPASALFGNASGGVLSFTTRGPALTPYNLEVTGVTGSDGLYRGQLTASGTVNGTGYIFAISGQTWDGYRNIAPASPRVDTLGTSYGSSERFGLNAQLSRGMAGGELSLTANLVDLDAESAGSKAGNFAPEVFREIADTYLRFRTGKTLKQQQVGLRWQGPLGAALEGDFSLYGVHRTINNPIPSDIIDLSRNGGGVRAQLGSTIASALGDLRWRGGVEYDLQDDDRSEVVVEFQSGLPLDEPYLDQAEEVSSIGAFIQGTLELPGGAVALAGLRYDRQEFTATDRVPVTPENPDDSGSRTLDAISPSIGVSVPAGPSLTFFGSIGTVFETPTTTELANRPDAAGGFNPDLDPMKGESYEAGLRGAIGNSATFEVTTYQTDLRNELVPFEVEGSPGVTFFRNAGRSRHRGVEASLAFASADGVFRQNVTYSYTNARFRAYELGDENLAGNQIPGVAPQRLQAVTRVSPDPFWVDAAWTYSDEVVANDLNTASAPSYMIVDLRAGVSDLVVGNLSLSPWVAVINVADKDYIASVAVNAFGSRFYEPGPDRSLQVGLTAKWGGGN